jgi:hypothetical protein
VSEPERFGLAVGIGRQSGHRGGDRSGSGDPLRAPAQAVVDEVSLHTGLADRVATLGEPIRVRPTNAAASRSSRFGSDEPCTPTILFDPSAEREHLTPDCSADS